MAERLLCVPCASASSPSKVKIRHEGHLVGHKERVFDIDWSPTQPSKLASVGATQGFVWSVQHGKAIAEPIELAGTEIMRVCWHLDGNHVITGDSKGKVTVCDANDGSVTDTLAAGGPEEDEVYGLQMLSSDGLLAAGAGPALQLWDLPRATCLVRTDFTIAEDGVIFGGAHRNPEGKAYLFNLAARGRALCAALSDGTVRLLDSQTLQPIGVLDEHARRGAPAFGVAMSPTSPMLATADAKGAVMLWDLRQAGRGPLMETCHTGAVHSLAFTSGVGGSTAELLVVASAERLILHETQTSLATESSVRMLDPLLCVKAAQDGATPRLAAAGGSGGLISDARISLLRLQALEDEVDCDAATGAKKRPVAVEDSVSDVAEGVEKKRKQGDAEGAGKDHD